MRICLFLLLCSAPLWADGDARAFIEDAQRRMDAAYTARDAAGFTSFLAPNFTVTEPGVPSTRKAYLKFVTDALHGITSASMKSRLQKFSESGDTATVWVRSDAELTMEVPPPTRLNPVRLTRISRQTWKRLGSEWRMSHREEPPLSVELQEMVQAEGAAPATARGELMKTHLTRLKQIVEDSGWPTLDQVGSRGEDAATTIAVHADLEFSKRCLALMKPGVKSGDVAVVDAVRMDDHLHVLQGQPQTYGTELKPVAPGKPLEPYPVENPAQLDERRRSAGLAPLADYLKAMRLLNP